MDNPAPRLPEPQHGDYGTVSEFGSLDGWLFEEADTFLTKHAELRRFHITLDGYRDASKVYIRPNGEIIRVPKPMYTTDGRKIKGYRYNVYESNIVRSQKWHELPRSEQEWVVM